ncbi:MAG: cytidylate kinase family protein, partial [Prevotella sp.]|nr:cytidylate kinase family protein [Prevotella sp.]
MNKNEKFVITINRELGSGGRTIGKLLAEKLGVSFYDKALIKELEKKFNLDKEEIERL